jgi:branched-chain amino acid transport system permease protein
MTGEIACARRGIAAVPNMRSPNAGRVLAIAAASVAALVAAVLPFFAATYAVTLATEIMISGVFASGINLLLGTTGLVSLGQAMFLGLGGYGIGIGSSLLGFPLWLSIPATLIAVVVVSAIVGLICTRTRGVEFLLITLAFSQMLYGAAIKLRITGGSDGMSGIPRPDLSAVGLSSDDPATFYYYVLVATAVSLLGLWRIVNSPFGSVLAGIRENERRIVAMGYAVDFYKVGAFTLGAAVCAAAGILQAQYTYFINPDSMSWQLSGEGVLMVIIGGASSVLGPLVGAAIFVLVKQGLSMLTGDYLMFFGLFFMLVVAFFRGGVFGAIRILLGART